MTLEEQINESKKTLTVINRDISMLEEKRKDEKSRLKKLEKELERRAEFEKEVAMYKPKMETR